VAGDGGAVVAEVDVGLVAGDALAGDAGALEAADELFGLAGEHGADDDFDSSRGGHLGMVLDFFWRGEGCVFVGFCVFSAWFFVVKSWYLVW